VSPSRKRSGRDTLPARTCGDEVDALHDDVELQRSAGDAFVVQGEFLLRREASEFGYREAEACFRRAFTIARRQQAKSLELRAAMSLTRLYQKQDRQAETRPLLAECYDWFTEGFDTPDLRDAKALLEQLS
jgi:hypothetical protein